MPAELGSFVRAQEAAPFTYGQVGATAAEMPPGWDQDEQWVALGQGEEVWTRARAALDRWTPFDLGWVEPITYEAPIREGELFGFVSSHFGVYSVNVCRVAYVLEDRGDTHHRYGFAHGTVGAHAIRGEECFLLEWDRATDEVRFGIRKFSRVRHWLLRLLGPLTRRVQDRFTRDALDRMRREVTGG